MPKLATAAAAALTALTLTAPPADATPFNMCPSGRTGIITGTPTTCPFADNVRTAWYTQPGNPISAYSPVTGMVYTMTCMTSTETVSGAIVNGYTCYGGNNAQVVVW